MRYGVRRSGGACGPPAGGKYTSAIITSDVYERITKRIVDKLEAGNRPWMQPCRGGRSTWGRLMVNACSGLKGLTTLVRYAPPFRRVGRQDNELIGSHFKLPDNFSRSGIQHPSLLEVGPGRHLKQGRHPPTEPNEIAFVRCSMRIERGKTSCAANSPDGSVGITTPWIG